MKNAIQAVFEVVMVILLSLFFAGVILQSCTSKEMWYAGSHDSQCEKMINGSECHCYERFMENGR